MLSKAEKNRRDLHEGDTREGFSMWSKRALLTDLYQLTMEGGYVQAGKTHQWANFDYFFRKVPDHGGY